MKIEELSIPGCYLISPKKIEDERGFFVKSYHSGVFDLKGIKFEACEEFYSQSKKNVVRGLHFQNPPYEHNKIVTCLKGAVLDFLVDIRIGSPTYGKHIRIELSEDNSKSIYIAKGIAHGFLSVSDESLMMYKTDTVYQPEYDTGICFYSCDIKVPIALTDIIMSDRDKGFIGLKDLESGFVYA